MSLAKLPAEIVVRVIGFTDPADVCRCMQVSRLFHSLVKSQTCLQYMLELGISGYTLPSAPRTDISYTEKIAILRKRRKNKQANKLVGPFFIPFPEEFMPWVQLVDGTVMFGFSDDSTFTRYVIFHQLPSRNRGTEHKHWKHDLGFETRHVLIRPDLDLLVAVEAVPHETPAPPAYVLFKFHLLTMSTCEPHPGVGCPGVVERGPVRTLDVDGTRFALGVWLYDHLLAAEFGGQENGGTYFVVWNWVLGRELVHVSTKNFRSNSFSFVSEEFFVVLCNAQQDYTGAHGDTLSHFDVYRINPTHPSTRLSPSRPIAKLALPVLRETQDYIATDLMSTMVLTAASSCCPTYPPPVPKVYELPSDGHILCLNIRIIAHLDHGDELRDRGCLFVASPLLLDMLGHQMENSDRLTNSPPPMLVIPWESWSSCTRYIDLPRDLEPPHCVSASGLLCASAIGLNITILDFSSRGWEAQKVQQDWVSEEEENPPPGTVQSNRRTHAGKHQRSLGQLFNRGDNTGRCPRYTRRALLAHEFEFHRNMVIHLDGEQVGVALEEQPMSPGGSNWNGIWMYEI